MAGVFLATMLSTIYRKKVLPGITGLALVILGFIMINASKGVGTGYEALSGF